jgi:hypothetical protein
MNFKSAVFHATLFVVCAFICLPDFPPLVDMSQHANQVTSLKAMLQGDFIWAELVELNLFTPFWTGYGIYLLLAFIFPILIATKLVICISFVAFVLSFSFLRKKFEAPQVLDWLLIPAFFGFSYEWAFLPFMISVPVGVLFYYLNLLAVQRVNLKNILAVLVSGIVLAFSHLLAFAFFGLVAFIHILMCHKIKRDKITFYIFAPYIVFACILLIFIFKDDALSAYYSYDAYPAFFWEKIGLSDMNWWDANMQYSTAVTITQNIFENLFSRLVELPMFVFATGYSLAVQVLLFSLVLCIPFLCGYRLSKKVSSYSMLIAFFLVWFALPHYMMKVIFVAERFSLLFVPAYILCFIQKTYALPLQIVQLWRKPIDAGFAKGITVVAVFVLTISALMYHPLSRLYSFAAEARQFRTLIEGIPGNLRALSLISVWGRNVHLRFLPNWYQSMKNGWVDFNLSGSLAQVVRFRPEKVPEVRQGNHLNPLGLVMSMKDCNIYDLVFIYTDAQRVDKQALSETACSAHELYRTGGNWYVFKRVDAK